MEKTARSPRLRDVQRTKTKEHLLLSAARLFGEAGFAETTIHDIAEASGASRATIYSHFESKNAILTEIAQLMWGKAEILYDAFGDLRDWNRDTIGAWLNSVLDEWESSSWLLRVESVRDHNYDEVYLDFHLRFVVALTKNGALWARFGDEEPRDRALFLISGLELFLNTWIVRGWPTCRGSVLGTLTDVWCSVLKVA